MNGRTDPIAGKVLARCMLHVPAEHNEMTYGLNVLLVGGNNMDYAAYIGWGSEDWVIAHGNKLPFIWAKGFFPQICEKDYRK